jgi:hypothetical protein
MKIRTIAAGAALAAAAGLGIGACGGSSAPAATPKPARPAATPTAAAGTFGGPFTVRSARFVAHAGTDDYGNPVPGEVVTVTNTGTAAEQVQVGVNFTKGSTVEGSETSSMTSLAPGQSQQVTVPFDTGHGATSGTVTGYWAGTAAGDGTTYGSTS